MQLDLQLTDNLILHYIEDNNFDEDKLITVELSFTFFGQNGTTYFLVEDLEDEYPMFASTSISGGLIESFETVLEDNMEVIIEYIKEFNNNWIKENAEYN